jgi:hypothetical protein
MRGLEQEGWLKRLVPGWSSAKANVAELEKLREAQMQLQMQGIVADASAAQFPLLTAKMPAKEVKALKKSFPRQGFVAEIDALEGEAKRFAAEMSGKQAASPSATWKLLMASRPEVVLWVAYSTKNAALQAKFQSFYTEWPQARQRVPYVQMQEMRIVAELAGFDDLVEKVFFELMDGKLGTVEEMKAFLEPYSPPAPPPAVHLRRARAAKKDAKAKSRKKAEAEEGLVEDAEGPDEAALVAEGAAAESMVATAKPVEKKAATAAKAVVPVKPVATAKNVTPAKAAVAKTGETKAAVKKPAAAKAVAKKAVVGKAASKKAAPAKKIAVKKTAPVKKVVAKKVPVKKVVKKPVAKAVVKAKTKAGAKAPARAVAKKAPAMAAATKAKSKPVAKSAAKTAGKSKGKTAAKGASAKKR